MNVINFSVGYFPDPSKGKPVSNGYIYVGIPDLDPETAANQKQISIRQEDGSVISVSQPLRTGAGGVPIYNGSPVTVMVTGDYSLKILYSSGSQAYYIPSSGGEDVVYLSESSCDIAQVISDIGSVNNTTVIVDCESIISEGETVTVTENICLNFRYGGTIDGVAGGSAETLTINGPLITGNYQIFGENLTVVAGSNCPTHEVYTEWWGALGDGDTTSDKPYTNWLAVEKAVTFLNGRTDGGTVKFLPGSYYWGGDRIALENINLIGAGRHQTKILLYNDGRLTSIPTTSKFQSPINNIKVSGVSFDNGGTWNYSDIVRIFWDSASTGNVEFSDCDFYCFNQPVSMVGGDNYKIVGNNFYNSPNDDGNGGSPVIAAFDGAENVLIDGNYFEPATRSVANGNVICSINVKMAEGRIVNNAVGGSYVAGIFVETDDTDRVIISNNNVDLSTQTQASGMFGIYMQKNIGNFLVSDNNIIGRGSSYTLDKGVQITGPVSGDLLANVKENTILDFYRGIEIGCPNEFISANIENNTVNGAYFGIIYSCSYAGLLAGDRRNVVRNNTIDSEGLAGSTGIELNIGLVSDGKDYGTMVMDGNTYHTEAAGLDMSGNLPKMYMGLNNSLNPNVRSILYRSTSALTADFVYLKSKILTSGNIDLSGGAYTDVLLEEPKNRLLRKVRVIYMEATSADPGIDVRIAHWPIYINNEAATITTSPNMAIGDVEEYDIGEIAGDGKSGPYSTSKFWYVQCAGTKTGAGGIMLHLEYLEDENVTMAVTP